VALLAREGGLDPELRREVYEGARLRGNMLPDVLTSQLRDESAAEPVGVRVLRIATHGAVRSVGLGSRLLSAVAAEFDADGWNGPVDYLGVGYGATPRLVRFWADNGFGTVHLATTRNDTSGEHSALAVRPLTDAGRALHDRSARFFARRIGSVLSDALREADPETVASVLGATAAGVSLDLTDREWRVVAAAAFGPGLYDSAPRPFARLALRAIVDGTATEPALLVGKALQGRRWAELSGAFDFVSRRAGMRAFGDAYRPLIDRYGTETARTEADRYR
jgi:tRNA(Met) cytidine acetyltransferase